MRVIFNDTVIIRKLKGAGNIRTLVTTATGEANIQPLGKDRGQVDVGTFGSSYIAYVEVDLPALQGDRVTDSNKVQYDITQVIVRDNSPFPYKELILKKTT